MNDFEKALHTLEYDKIVTMLSEIAATNGAKEAIRDLKPVSDEYVVRRLQMQTSNAKRMSATLGAPSFGGIADIRDSVDRAAKGACLGAHELLQIADLLYTTDRLIAYASGKNTDPGCLSELFFRLFPDTVLQREIRRILPDEETVADDASPKLYEIRRAIRNTNAHIRDTLQKYVAADNRQSYLQDNVVTQRNGRYVIPVKIEHKNDVKGLVHDTSSSGATLFIEPIAVVEANNELRRLEGEEKKEIERILYSLSASCADIGERLRLNYENLTELAVIFAKAELSWKMNATEPVLSTSGEIVLRGARHPLLDQTKVVPTDIRLGGEFDTLVITGPNTGGKTVSLKTLGLLTLMAQAGLHVPAKADSKLRIFEKVLSDIGDEQSIEQSLSTFSAHMKTIVEILEKADDRSLVLFDELGAGTDPTEGAALAVAIVEKVREKKALCAATTHYAEMKIYALDTEGVSNAACEFDVSTLAPTYRLIIGAPGKSNAFAISARLGLDPEVIGRAESFITADNRRFESVIEGLEADRLQAEKNREEATRLREKYDKLVADTQIKMQEKLDAAEKERQRAFTEAARIIESARQTSEFVLDELEKQRRKLEKEKRNEELADVRRNLRKTLKESEDEVNPVIERKLEGYKLPRPLKIGDEVLVIDINKKAYVEKLPDKNNEVAVRAGIINMKTPLTNLMLCEDAPTFTDKDKRKIPTASVGQSITQGFSIELDLRGRNCEEGWQEVDKYLDSALIAGVLSVRIIHGKGTGVLRNYLWERFRKDHRIKSFRMGNFGEGDGGVTVVELK